MKKVIGEKALRQVQLGKMCLLESSCAIDFKFAEVVLLYELMQKLRKVPFDNGLSTPVSL